MTLPSSGPISLAQIAAEFGGTAPHSLSEYYGAAAGIPTSGPISFSQFYGKSAVIVTRVNITIDYFVINPPVGGATQWWGITPDGGSASPSALKGVPFVAATGFVNTVATVSLAGNLPKDFFVQADFEGVGALQSANATHGYNSSNNSTSWSWGIGHYGGWNSPGSVRYIDFHVRP